MGHVIFYPSIIIFHLIELVLNVQAESLSCVARIKILQTREPELWILTQDGFMLQMIYVYLKIEKLGFFFKKLLLSTWNVIYDTVVSI